MEFDVFLSHNSIDKPVVRELKTLLVANGLRPWLDEDELQPGIPWQQLLEAGVKTSKSVIVLVGKDGLGPWEDEEMQAALVLAVRDKRPCIPVLLPGASMQPELPMFLGNRTWVDLRAGFGDEGLAKLIWGITGKKPQRIERESSRRLSDAMIAPTRLHHGADHLFGREDELAALDQIWNDPTKKVLTIVAFGGVGKTSLVIEWMGRQAAKNWEGFERVFDWSFFSQGTREQGGPSAEGFIAEALRFFGDEAMGQSAASAWDKGARLAQLVAQRRTLLVLDGLEPLQHPPGPLAGEVKDPALATLLKGLARSNSGLCIVTTRERVTDLAPFGDSTAPEWQLHHLSNPAGVELLKTLGVRGTATEFQRLVEKVKGHALTLNLLGRYLAKAHGGDIRKSDQVKFEKADAATQGGYAFKTIGAYETWLNEGEKDGARQLAVLRLLGLFDRPADVGCMAALRSKPAIAGLTEPLVGLDEDDWNLAISSLEECGLVSRGQLETPNSKLETALDAHPLIREYFAKQLREKKPEAWRGAHRRLYEHLCATTSDKKPNPTLEDLQPLYQAVAHGCQAGLQQNACVGVFHDRLMRGSEEYTIRKLGAFGSDLAAVACFFETVWIRISPALTEITQGWLLNQAAFYLRGLGRLTEALEPMRAGLPIYLKQKHWGFASRLASNLSELKLTLGEVAGAVGDAEQSVSYADRSGDAFIRGVTRTSHADALHQAGDRIEAEARFREAEALQAERRYKYPLLFSLAGFQYCDLLLREAERTAWQQIQESGVRRQELELVNACRAVSKRTTQTLGWLTNQFADTSLLDIALDHLTLSRAALYAAILEQSEIRNLQSEIETAVTGLRRASQQQFLPLGLLTRAWLRSLIGATKGPEEARSDVDEAWEIAERGPMKLFMADIHLYRARLFHGVKPYPWTSPREDLVAARKLIEQCGYWRRKEELEDAEAAAKNW
ncbi:MAG: hypothetical protein QOH41_1229 [Blastocatellia bacterium]|jgi:tetratricopeptide (TPR) repeat protein|nr:hypothetical protein [Blastocatellia bacterium]